jgi:hypothetical protein
MPGVFDLSSDESSSEAAEADLLTDPREPLPNFSPSHQSAQRAEVQATNIKRGFVKLYLIATCFMLNQPMY